MNTMTNSTSHIVADCTFAGDALPFTGTCHICNQEGHPASKCPEKPGAGPCKVCGNEGHKASACDNRVDVFPQDLPDWTGEQAWDELVKADKEKDLDDIKTVSTTSPSNSRSFA